MDIMLAFVGINPMFLGIAPRGSEGIGIFDKHCQPEY
jgi:hypothetical protein